MAGRYVVIGDTHLQSTNPRNADRLKAFDQVIREGQLAPVSAWLHLGDVFHTRSTPDDRVAVAERLTRMADVAPVVVIYGNHEAVLDLHVFSRLKAKYHVTVIDAPRTVRLELATGGHASVFCLPYPTKAGLVSAGIEVGDVQSVASTALDAIFMTAADQLRLARDHGDDTLMIAHATIAQCRTSAGQPMGVHGEIVVTPQHLNRLGAVPKLFGHIHLPQDIFGATYAGSIARLDFAEVEEKRWIELVYESPTDWVQHSHPIDCPPRYHVEGELSRDGFTWQATKGPGGALEQAPASWRGCEVRVRYRFNQSQRGALDQARVLAEFAEALRVEVEPIAVPDRQLRAPAVAEARTLEQKLAAYLTVEEVPAALVEKLRALETSEGAALLTRVQQDLAAIEAGEESMVAA